MINCNISITKNDEITKEDIIKLHSYIDTLKQEILILKQQKSAEILYLTKPIEAIKYLKEQIESLKRKIEEMDNVYKELANIYDEIYKTCEQKTEEIVELKLKIEELKLSQQQKSTYN